MIKPACEDAYLIQSKDLRNSYYSLTFGSFSKAGQCRPGHFVHVQLPCSDVFLRRPMSVASVSRGKKEIEIILKVLGRGTRMMSDLKKGDRINILGPLGVPFRLPRRSQTVIMVAGGVGFPPLLYLATEMVAKGHDPVLIEFFYGGRSAGDIVEKPRIKKLGLKFHPVTEDGSLGSRGLVTQAVEEYITSRKGTVKPVMYGCGPEGMLKETDELGRKYGIGGQLSLEAPMPCGIGICLGCVVNLRQGGHARVCCDGPVFDIGEVIL